MSQPKSKPASPQNGGWPPAAPCARLARSLGAQIVGLGFVVELDFLNGRKKFEGTEVFSLLHYDK